MAQQPDTLDQIMREWARVHIQRADIMNHNGAMLAYTDKANAANKLGLSDYQKLGVTPFPSPTNTSLSVGIPQDQLAEIIAKVLESKEEEPKEEEPKEEEPKEEEPKDNLKEKEPEIYTPMTTEPQGISTTQKVINGVLVALAAGGLTLGTLSYLNKPKDPVEGQIGVEVEGWQTTK